ncbi:hypothetical protein ACXHXM_25935
MMSDIFSKHQAGRVETSSKLNKRSKPNALRNAQVMPPHRVDLTLSPSTLEQIFAPPDTEAKKSSRFEKDIAASQA